MDKELAKAVEAGVLVLMGLMLMLVMLHVIRVVVEMRMILMLMGMLRRMPLQGNRFTIYIIC